MAAFLLGGTIVLLGSATCNGKADSSSSGASVDPGTLVAFVYDRSASMAEYKLELARKLTEGRVNELDYADRIAALEMLQHSLNEPPRRWTQAVPEAEFPGEDVYQDSVRLARFKRDARDYLRRFTEPEGRSHIRGTDLFSTMHDLASIIEAYPEMHPVVYIFSDMLQSTGPIEMAGLRRMPPAGWVERQERDGQLPDLSGACIFVVGARVDTDAGQRVMTFWKEYFQATGAEFLDSNYTLRPVRLPTFPCR